MQTQDGQGWFDQTLKLLQSLFWQDTNLNGSRYDNTMISRIWIDEDIGVTLSEGQSLLLSQNIKNKSVTQINYYNMPAQCGVLPDW